MKREIYLHHQFVEFIPKELSDYVIYISIPYSTVAHKCCCGCGNEIITPLSPTDWKLIFDGESISLEPSIGNWSYGCQSHYWIRNNKVRWSTRLSKDQIQYGRLHDLVNKEQYYNSKYNKDRDTTHSIKETFLSKLKKRFLSKKK